MISDRIRAEMSPVMISEMDPDHIRAEMSPVMIFVQRNG